MKVTDIMVRKVVTVRPEVEIAELCEIFQLRNIHGAPVVDEDGFLLGIVTQEDVIYGSMGLEHPSRDDRNLPALMRGAMEGPPVAGEQVNTVEEIMTAPAISVEEGTSVDDVCRLMWTLKIHRLPVVRKGKVTGIISSLDVVRALTQGRISGL
jgi:CBS domain-containing protein